MCSRNCIYSPVNKGFIGEISYLRSHNRFESTYENNFNYTDDHDVDEETRTIASQGGHWNTNTRAGIAFRYVFDGPLFFITDVAYDNVASKNNHTLSLQRKSV